MHPLDCQTNSTGSMLGLVDIHCFFEELLATFLYKYPFPPFLLHAYSELQYAPRLPELREPYNLERLASLEEFREEEPMSLLGFEVTLAYPAYLALFHFLNYVLTSFPKSLLIISLKVLNVFKDPLQFHVVCAYLLAQRRYRSLEIPQELCIVRILGSVLNLLSGRMPSGPNMWSVGSAPILSICTCTLQLSHIFGLNKDQKNGVLYPL